MNPSGEAPRDGRSDGATDAADDSADDAGVRPGAGGLTARTPGDGTEDRTGGDRVPAEPGEAGRPRAGSGGDAAASPSGRDSEAASGAGAPRSRADRTIHGSGSWTTPPPPAPSLLAGLQAAPPSAIGAPALWAVLATGVLSMLLLGDGLAINLLLAAIPAALAAYFAGRAAERRVGAWSLVWAVGCLGLLVVPALRDADWPSFLAVVSAVALGSLALNGGRTWAAVLLSPIGVFNALVPGPVWGWRGLRERFGGARRGVGVGLRALVAASVLLLVFGALFAGADAAFASLLADLMPDASVTGGPWHLVLLASGLVGALAVAHTAAAPTRWDRMAVPAGRPRNRVEWALPLVLLVVLFAAFNAVQLAVLFGGYDAVLEKTGQTYAEYARQGFWQLLLVTVLTLLVVVFALRWAPRDGAGDRNLVRGVLGTLCALALVVVASAVRRMDMYVEAYGLTRLRVSVVAGELWLGLVIVLIMAAGVWGARWLPRAVAASAAAGVLAFGLMSPDGLIAERNVQRYEDTGKFDLDYARTLSADAVPALDELQEPMRSCALRVIAGHVREDRPWYATSLGQARAADILRDRPLSPAADGAECGGLAVRLTTR